MFHPLNFVFADDEDESPKKKRKRCVFPDNEANDNSDDEEEEEGANLKGFIDHDIIDADDPSYYHVVNQQLQQEETNHEEEVSCEDQEDEGIVYPLKVTKHECERHINLLLTEEDGVHHYSVITNFSRLVGSQYTQCKKTHFYCYSCLHGIKIKQGEETRDQCKLLHPHQKQCKTLNPRPISSILPKTKMMCCPSPTSISSARHLLSAMQIFNVF